MEKNILYMKFSHTGDRPHTPLYCQSNFFWEVEDKTQNKTCILLSDWKINLRFIYFQICNIYNCDYIGILFSLNVTKKKM